MPSLYRGVVLCTQRGCTQILTSQNRKREITSLAIGKFTREVWQSRGLSLFFSAGDPMWSIFLWEVLSTVLVRPKAGVLQKPPRQEREAWRNSLGPPALQLIRAPGQALETNIIWRWVRVMKACLHYCSFCR